MAIIAICTDPPPPPPPPNTYFMTFVFVVKALFVKRLFDCYPGEVKSKSKFNSLDRISKRKTESRKNNKNPPSLVVVDTDDTHVKQNSNILTLSRKDKKKKRQVCRHSFPVHQFYNQSASFFRCVGNEAAIS